MASPNPTPPRPSWAPTDFWRTALEVALGLALIGEAVTLLLLHRQVPTGLEVALWIQWVVTVVALRQRGYFLLFGPVLFYDLVRAARRSRYVVIRCLYAGLLALMLGWVYMMWLMSGYHRTSGVEARRMAEFADGFFWTFMLVQFVVVVILTPGYTAGAIAEEKERRTLEFMLATDLRNREIVLSKLASRIVNLTLLIMVGLPILSFMQFLGGMDPNLLLAGFAATFLTMLSLAGLSIFHSVHFKKPRDAIAMTYVIFAAYLLVTFFANLALKIPFFGGNAFTALLIDVVDVASAGNIINQLMTLSETVRAGQPLEDELPAMLRNYAIFHGLIAILCPLYATARLRVVALHEAHGEVKKLPLLTRLIGRPRPGYFPMIWKEVFAERGLRLHWVGRIVVGVLVLASFIPVGFIVYDFLEHWLGYKTYPRYGGWDDWGNPWFRLAQGMNIWVRVVGTMVAMLTLLGVAVKAAGTVTGEREKQTLDELLTSPLSASSIIFAKWLGAICSVRWAWLWLGTIWGLGVLTQGLHLAALPLLVFTWLVYAATIAGIGILYSVLCKSTLRATLWTLAMTVFVGGGHWLVAAMLIYLPLAALGGPGREIEWIAKLECGQTPAFVMGIFAFWYRDITWTYDTYSSYARREMFEMVAVSIVGLVTWAIAAVILYCTAAAIFSARSNRAQFLSTPRRPEPRPRLGEEGKARRPVLDAVPVEAEPILDALPVGKDEHIRDATR